MKKKKTLSILLSLIALFTITFCFSMSVFASEAEPDAVQTETVSEEQEADDSVLGTKALAAAIVVGVAAAAGAVGMGIAISKSAESMARQPEASGKINSAMMLGLVFIETLIIYALIVAILIIFVLYRGISMPLNIDFLQILLHIFNFLILAGGLTILLYKPISRFMEERRSYFEGAEQDIERKTKEAEALKAEYEQKLKESKDEINELRIASEKEAVDAAKLTIEKSRETAHEIIQAAEKEAEERKEHILDLAQGEISELVVSATEKLLSDTASAERDSALYDEFIRLAEKKIDDKRSSK